MDIKPGKWCIANPQVRRAALKIACGRYQHDVILGLKPWSSRTRSPRYKKLAMELQANLLGRGYEMVLHRSKQGALVLEIIKPNMRNHNEQI